MKPMKAAPVESTAELNYPLFVSPKLDGIRCLVVDGRFVSRKLKPIPNKYVQAFCMPWMEGMDGELIVGKPWDKDVYRATNSGVMSREGSPRVTFFVFDCCNVGRKMSYVGRFELVRKAAEKKSTKFLRVLTYAMIKDEKELLAYEEKMLAKGYEGLILRSPLSPYKFGRSTPKEGWLWKLKRFEDSEAVIIDTVELKHNRNTAKKDALGNTKRSSHKAGKVAGGVLGALMVKDVKTGVAFEIGSGFTAKEKKDLWKRRAKLKGLIVKYKFFAVGVKDKPRHPVFLGMRAAIDA